MLLWPTITENHTGDTQGDDFYKLYSQEFPVTKAFAIGLGIGELVGAGLIILPLTFGCIELSQKTKK